MPDEEYFNYIIANNSRYGGGCGSVFFVVLIVVTSLLLCGCRTQYVPVETIKEVYITKHDSITLRDSIWQHDSVFVSMKGDTVLVEKWRTKYVEHLRDVVKIDSFIKTDSIQVPYPVERKATRWEKFCLDYGKIMFGGTIVGVIAVIAAIILWLRRKAKI